MISNIDVIVVALCRLGMVIVGGVLVANNHPWEGLFAMFIGGVMSYKKGGED